MSFKPGLSVKLVIVLALIAGSALAESDFYKEFKDYYEGSLLTDLSRKPAAEKATIKDFVYRKDVAEFRFDEGEIYVLRNVLGRPTTAIFIGKGSASIDIPVHTERMALYCCTNDSTVSEQFENCFIRMGDDFDLKLREQFTFEETSLPWRDFNEVNQGEFFFDPVVMHERDNLFQLLRSVYERKEDGYFWIDFNRYVYSFDPNRAEEVVVAYEREGGDIDVTPGAVIQRQEKRITEDRQVSDIIYPTTIIKRSAELDMAGADGSNIRQGLADLTLQLNSDSTRFVSLFLHRNLKLDSMYYNGRPVDYHRRRTFTFIGVILPEVARKGDTLNFRLWYHGKQYGSALPFVADPAARPIDLTFTTEKGYSYLMPGKGEIIDIGGGQVQFRVEPDRPYTSFSFQPMSSGIDTVPLITDMGMTLNIIKSDYISKRNFDCFVPDDLYQEAVLGAFNYATGQLGMPQGVFEMFAYPDSSLSMPGLMVVPQTICLRDGTGGIHMAAGNAAARQWFGPTARTKTDREFWLMDAVTDYLSLMYVGQSIGMNVFFGELANRRDFVYTQSDNHRDIPLAAGRRIGANLRTAKGVWLIHMLRFLMYDLETGSDLKFQRFINALATTIISQDFSNSDFVKLAEKFYGEPLDWFFHHWLYGGGIPKYKVDYKVQTRSDEYFITANVKVEKVEPNFAMPIIMRVLDKTGKSAYFRKMIEGRSAEFELGPFAAEPDEFIFNELYSVLARTDVNKK